ncbi:MAG: restriction endonuclease [Xenococcus sp. MO_188.B8]|nr:restriction endonuclease [Xenococcus sp. MO_188.B8]
MNKYSVIDSNNWKEFERIVTAIHIAETKGAKVVWDETIEGRQFDVTIRFKQGLYSYLTLIECKKYKNPISVDKIDSFVTKSRDANANKAIIISTSGFQSGCLKVAKRHSIELFTLKETVQVPEEFIGSKTPALLIYDICLIFDSEKKSRYNLPDENGKLAYLGEKSLLIIDGKEIDLHSLINQELSLVSIEDNFPIKKSIALEKSLITVPDLFDKKEISAIEFSCNLVELARYKGLPLDHHQIEKIHTVYELFDAVKNEKASIEALNLSLGFDTIMEAGKFYTKPLIGANYFCKEIDNNIAHLFQVESYYYGNLIQAELWQNIIEYQKQYIEILDTNEVERLRKMYEKLQQTEISESNN